MEKFEQGALETNVAIADKIDDFAESIDLFLAGKKFIREKNESSFRIIGFAERSEGGAGREAVYLDFNLRLPNLEEYWQLKFTTVESNEFQSLDKNRPGSAPGQRKYVASLGFFDQLGKVRTSFQPRIELSDPLQTSYVLEFSQTSQSKFYNFRPRLKFFADSQKGTGQAASFNVDFQVRPLMVFRFITEQQYLDLQGLFSTNLGPEILVSLSKKTGLSTSFTFYSTNRPSYHLDHYLLSYTIRHELYKKILYAQLSPNLLFPKDHGFKGVAGISANVELIF
ncbi:MAG: hypothetical protein SGJ18_07100 [Pseudomonadota bacterium]|nr:hypothetical protein [Pseudomonadota bacterium]